MNEQETIRAAEDEMNSAYKVDNVDNAKPYTAEAQAWATIAIAKALTRIADAMKDCKKTTPFQRVE